MPPSSPATGPLIYLLLLYDAVVISVAADTLAVTKGLVAVRGVGQEESEAALLGALLTWASKGELQGAGQRRSPQSRGEL